MKQRFLSVLFSLIFFYSFSQDTLFIDSHIIIQMGDSMIIPKNTVVFFQGNYQIAVVGCIKAQGTADEPIIFTSQYDPNNPTFTSWKGIAFTDIDNNFAADSSIFEYCTFQYSYASAGCSGTTGLGGAIRAWNSSRVRFSHCTFEENFAQIYGGAVYLEESDMQFDHCFFNHNSTDTSGTTSGGCMAIINSSPTLNRCVIANSYSNSVGGGIIAMNCDSAKIVNCEFYGNSGTTGGSMFISGCAFMLFSNNLFHHNDGRYFGGGIALKNSSFRIINCTFTENFGGQGGGIYCSSGVNCHAYNSIFCHNEVYENANGPQIYIAYQESTINFFNCLVVNGFNDFGGSGSGVNFHGIWDQVIEDEMEFVSCGDGYEYCLPENSPCINYGSMKVINELPELDLRGQQRIINGKVDLGAFESIYNNDIQEFEKCCVNIFPNPTKNHVFISLNDDALIGTLCFIYDLQGKKIESLIITKKHFEIPVEHFANGIYIVAGEGWQQKLVVNK